MARGLPFTYGPSRTALESSTARAMGVIIVCKLLQLDCVASLPDKLYPTSNYPISLLSEGG